VVNQQSHHYYYVITTLKVVVYGLMIMTSLLLILLGTSIIHSLGNNGNMVCHKNRLRTNIGIVSQEPVLFNASIKDNLRYANANASDEELER
jgi:ABC-type transport system involved in cytochrome bd biosynthesis fused ATPase/permease subunit